MRNINPPADITLLNELFSWLEVPRLLARSPHLLNGPRGKGERVIVLPGFGAGDLSTLPLRRYLSSLGYRVRGWSKGQNNAEVLYLIDEMRELTLREAAASGDPVTLIGWSLGGYIAREVAREIPESVRTVITLGSPVVGGPKYTRVAPVFTGGEIDLDEIEREIDRRANTPLKVPVTAIYSKFDGIVAWEACIDQRSDCVEHIEVAASHLGLGISADVYQIIAEKLAA